MRLRALLWPTLIACAASCGRIDFDAQPGIDGGQPGIDGALIDAPMPPDPPPDTLVDPDTLWWDPGWAHRVRVSFDTAELEATGEFEELKDIPLAVRIEESGLDPNKVQLGAGDIRFVASDNKSELAYEIEARPSSNDDVVGAGAVFWVKVPLIRKGDPRNYIWLYYGNPEATDAQKPSDVWSADYVAVWHLGEPDLERKDSTANARHLIGDGQKGAPQDGDLLLADSIELSPDDPKPLQHPPLADQGFNVIAFTVEAFVRPAHSDGDMMISAASDGVSARSFELRRVAEGEKIEFAISLDCTNMLTAVHDSDPVDVARWHHIAATYNGDKMRIYHNGFLTTELPVVAASQYPVCNAQAPFTLGALDSQSLRFAGRVDELRLSTRAQPPAWIKAQYLSARATAKLIVYGEHETRP